MVPSVTSWIPAFAGMSVERDVSGGFRVSMDEKNSERKRGNGFFSPVALLLSSVRLWRLIPTSAQWGEEGENSE